MQSQVHLLQHDESSSKDPEPVAACALSMPRNRSNSLPQRSDPTHEDVRPSPLDIPQLYPSTRPVQNLSPAGDTVVRSSVLAKRMQLRCLLISSAHQCDRMISQVLGHLPVQPHTLPRHSPRDLFFYNTVTTHSRSIRRSDPVPLVSCGMRRTRFIEKSPSKSLTSESFLTRSQRKTQ